MWAFDGIFDSIYSSAGFPPVFSTTARHAHGDTQDAVNRRKGMDTSLPLMRRGDWKQTLFKSDWSVTHLIHMVITATWQYIRNICQQISHLLVSGCAQAHPLLLLQAVQQENKETPVLESSSAASYKEARETRDRFISQTSASERIVGRAWPDPHSGQGRWLQCQWAARWVQFKRRSRTN